LAVTAITAVGAFCYTMYKFAKRIDQAVGVDEHGRTLSQRMGRVEYQLWPNGGESLADQINTSAEIGKSNATELKIVKELVMMIVQSHQETETKKVVKASRKRSA